MQDTAARYYLATTRWLCLDASNAIGALCNSAVIVGVCQDIKLIQSIHWNFKKHSLQLELLMPIDKDNCVYILSILSQLKSVFKRYLQIEKPSLNKLFNRNV